MMQVVATSTAQQFLINVFFRVGAIERLVLALGVGSFRPFMFMRRREKNTRYVSCVS